MFGQVGIPDKCKNVQTPFRQLLADFDRCAFVGFWFALRSLPVIMARREDAPGLDLVSGDISKRSGVESILAKLRCQIRAAVANEPQIKIMLLGNFLDMISRGALNV